MTNIDASNYKKIVGTEYEYYVLNKIQKDYDKVWHWLDFPEELMYENELINNYQQFCQYKHDIGADLVAFKDGKYYFIQCKNFNDTICMEKLAGFYFLLYEYNLNGVLCYNGTLSARLTELSNGKVPFINIPFNNENINVGGNANVNADDNKNSIDKEGDNDDNNFNIIQFRETTKDIAIDKAILEIFFRKLIDGNELKFDMEDSLVALYLDVTINNIRSRLQNKYSKIKTFKENEDFIKKKSGSTSGVIYIINYQCFQKLVMKGGTAKSEQFALYFIKLRQYIVKNN